MRKMFERLRGWGCCLKDDSGTSLARWRSLAGEPHFSGQIGSEMLHLAFSPLAADLPFFGTNNIFCKKSYGRALLGSRFKAVETVWGQKKSHMLLAKEEKWSYYCISNIVKSLTRTGPKVCLGQEARKWLGRKCERLGLRERRVSMPLVRLAMWQFCLKSSCLGPSQSGWDSFPRLGVSE